MAHIALAIVYGLVAVGLLGAVLTTHIGRGNRLRWVDGALLLACVAFWPVFILALILDELPRWRDGV